MRTSSARPRSSRAGARRAAAAATPDDWITALAAERRPAETLRAYARDIRQFTHWYERANDEPFRVERLAGIDVRDYVRSLVDAGRPPSSVNRLLASVRHFVRWAYERGAIPDQAMFEVGRVKFMKVPRRAPRSLPLPQIRKLLKELEHRGSLRDVAALHLLLFCGARVSEVAGARRDDLSLSPRKGSFRIRAANAKGRKERIVPVPLTAREHLVRYLESRTDDDEALFVGQRGPLKSAALRRILERYAAPARVDVSPHVLRHNFAMAFLDANANDLVALADLLGHESLNTTRLYTRRRFEDLEHAAERVQFA